MLVIILLSCFVFFSSSRTVPFLIVDDLSEELINVEKSKPSRYKGCGHHFMENMASNLDLFYINATIGSGVKRKLGTLSNYERRVATMQLAYHAVKLPAGDFVETGVYTGGTVALMMRILLDFDTCSRKLYAFDSFEGLPAQHREDFGGINTTVGMMASSLDLFTKNIKSLGLWNPEVLQVAKGWFNATLFVSPVKHISFLRLDGDLFMSTWEALTAFYDKVVPGGIIYVDDYGSFIGCKHAIDLFRETRGILDPLYIIKNVFDGSISFESVWWRKQAIDQENRQRLRKRRKTRNRKNE